MDNIKWGIIGCGDVTEVKSGPAFNKVPNSSLVAVMRRDAARAEDYARRHGVPKWYDNAAALINDPEVNAVYIATPPLQHEEYTLQCMQAGKPVYVEKPMTLNTESAYRMQDAAIRHNVKLTVAHYRRAQPMFRKIKALLEEKAIGDIRFVSLQMLQPPVSPEDNWRVDPAVSGGGLFHDLAPHQLDLMTWFFGRARSATGIARNQTKMYRADDLVSGNILFENGIVFNGIWCFSVGAADKADVCEITGSLGKIRFPVFGHSFTLSINGAGQEFAFDALQHVQQPMIEQVTAFFLDKGPNPCSAEEAILSMQLMDSFTKKDKMIF